MKAAQIPGNALDQRLHDATIAGDIRLDMRSVFLQGLLVGPQAVMAAKVPAAAQHIARFHAWAALHNLSPVQAAIAVAKSLPHVSGYVLGVDSVVQLAEILGAWQGASALHAPELGTQDLAIIRPDKWVTAA